MPRYFHNIEQNSPEWNAARAGFFTASSAAVVMGGLETKGLDDLITRIAWERIFGPTDEPHFQSGAMRRGHDLEHEARAWAEFNADCTVEQCGFVHHGTVPFVGWSPDALYLPRRKRAAEIKCLLHKAFLDVLFDRKVPAEYRWQTRWGMWVGDLDELDFVVYHPGPGGLAIQVERDRNFDDQMQARVELLEQTRVAPLVERLGNIREEALA